MSLNTQAVAPKPSQANSLKNMIVFPWGPTVRCPLLRSHGNFSPKNYPSPFGHSLSRKTQREAFTQTDDELPLLARRQRHALPPPYVVPANTHPSRLVKISAKEPAH